MAEERTQGGLIRDEEALAYIIGLLIGLVVVGAILDRLYEYFVRDASIIEWFLNAIEPYLFILYVLSFLITGLLVAAVIYMRGQIEMIIEQERTQLYPSGNMGSEPLLGEEEQPKNPQWERIEEHINSENPGDWRVAILEADIMLDEMLDSMSYHGETIGDKLKQVERSDFTTIDQAWEAHKVRNQIAHEGGNFALSAREARRVINLYRAVFDEFQYI